MATIDQQFVEYIVKTLVNNPDKVDIERKIDEKGVLLSLSVDPEDVGRVIGRRGATAQSIRTLLRALGTKNDARYNLKIVNTDGDRVGTISSDDSENDYEHTEPTAVRTVADEEIDGIEEPTSDLAEKTRADLADLDDLDI
ncbi:MAG: KH domain-containing protein [Candidatus Saccharibacteria bacterium]|nr:KH domain-containing protein [Candidatus Saccharibacteria bacterium]MDO4967595.1 KH domain-containing protein [Candidatus Saccharibacteria bacterium]